jgi:MFS family permease
VQGIATGALLAAAGAAMLDLDRRRGALANSSAPGAGTAAGALLSALAVQYLPAPTHLIYLVLLGVFAAQAAGVLAMPETAPSRPGALRSLVPDIRLPRAVRGEVAIAAPVLFAVWALAGFYGSLGPAPAATVLHSSSVVYGGLSLFILAGMTSGSALVLDRAKPRAVLYLGIAALLAGIALTLLATSADSALGFFTGTAIAGIGFPAVAEAFGDLRGGPGEGGGRQVEQQWAVQGRGELGGQDVEVGGAEAHLPEQKPDVCP